MAIKILGRLGISPATKQLEKAGAGRRGGAIGGGGGRPTVDDQNPALPIIRNVP